MKAELKLQIDAIKGERIYYHDFGEDTLLLDNYTGVYLKQSELKIDKSKMIDLKKCAFDPLRLEKDRTKAKETRTAYKTLYRGLAIKLIANEGDEYCYVQEKLLKMFPGYTELFIKSKSDIVLVKKNGLPYGLILPILIDLESE